MKKLQFMAWPKLCTAVLLGTAALFTASCARDGFDNDEKFESSVRNQQLANPAEDDITIEPTTDRKQTHIKWKVVNGASRYECKVYNITDGQNEVILDSIVDGVDFYIPRVRNTEYRFTIHTLANTSLGNTSPLGVTTKDFDALLEIYATIDDPEHGTSADDPINLNEYFYYNPIPTNLDLSEFNFNLVSGKYYSVGQENPESTIPSELKFTTAKPVMLRSEDETMKAHIIMKGDAGFVPSAEFALEGLDITCSSTSKALVALSSEPLSALKSDKDYYIVNGISISGCDIHGLTGSLVYANKKEYWIVSLNIENSLIELASVTDNLKDQSLISLTGANYSGAKDFNMNNCTVYQTGEGTVGYFLRYGNNARVDRPSSQWTNSDHTNINYTYNTFYKLACTWGNYNQFANYTLYQIVGNIWYDSGKDGNLDYIIGGRRYGTNSEAKWNLNTYWYNNADASAITTKDDGTKLTTDPNFVNPADGDFTPQGAEQVANKAGDQRWYK